MALSGKPPGVPTLLPCDRGRLAPVKLRKPNRKLRGGKPHPHKSVMGRRIRRWRRNLELM